MEPVPDGNLPASPSSFIASSRIERRTTAGPAGAAETELSVKGSSRILLRALRSSTAACAMLNTRSFLAIRHGPGPADWSALNPRVKR